MEISRDGLGGGGSLSANKPPQAVSSHGTVLRALENSSFFEKTLGRRYTFFIPPFSHVGKQR
jgi:hypothetical protein